MIFGSALVNFYVALVRNVRLFLVIFFYLFSKIFFLWR